MAFQHFIALHDRGSEVEFPVNPADISAIVPRYVMVHDVAGKETRAHRVSWVYVKGIVEPFKVSETPQEIDKLISEFLRVNSAF